MTETQTSILDAVLEHSNQEWRDAALTAIRHLAASGRTFQAADVARIAGEPGHPSQWGAVMARAARDGVIRHHGYAPSSRTTVRGSILKTWVGASC